MIIKNDFFKDRNYLQEEKEGLDRAVENFNKRYKKGEVKKEKFFKTKWRICQKTKSVKWKNKKRALI